MIHGQPHGTLPLIIPVTKIYDSEKAQNKISKGKRHLGQSPEEPGKFPKVLSSPQGVIQHVLRPPPAMSSNKYPVQATSVPENPVGLSKAKTNQANKQIIKTKQSNKKNESELILNRNELLSSENASNLAVGVPTGLTHDEHTSRCDHDTARDGDGEGGQPRGRYRPGRGTLPRVHWPAAGIQGSREEGPSRAGHEHGVGGEAWSPIEATGFGLTVLSF